MSLTPESESLPKQSCPRPHVCPLSRIRAGDSVRIKQLLESSGMASRLRELGFCEDQVVRLIARQSTFICQICNARLAISAKLAEYILVEPLHTALVS